jgi:glycosyltransferase involved in cell wall biosynthesis
MSGEPESMSPFASAGEKGKSKILLLDLGASFGGVENYLISLTKLLHKDFQLYGLCVNAQLAERLGAENVQVQMVPCFSGLLKPLRFLVALAVLPAILIRERIRVVQVNGLLESLFLLPCRMLGRRTVYTRHGPFEVTIHDLFLKPLRFLPRAVARTFVHFASIVVCVSETVGEGVAEIRPRLPITVIPNWIGSQESDKPKDQTSRSKVKILCASRLEHYKGIHLVIEAIRGLPDVEVIVVGDGPFRSMLEEMALCEPVTFPGFQSDMHPYYETADIFVMPSMGPEGLPMSSLEAMGKGLPCIFSDLPVHREITQGGRGALLFQSGNAGALRIALQTMTADPSLRDRFGKEAKSIVSHRYTADCVKEAYLKVFADHLT